MMDHGLKVSEMAMEFRHGLMDQSIKASGSGVMLLEKDLFNIAMEICL